MPRKGENIYKRKDGRWEVFDDVQSLHCSKLFINWRL